MAAGITTVALPTAAMAVSFAGATLATTAPQNLLIDDSGTVLGDHDVTLRLTLLDASGGQYSGNVRVDLSVTLDDGEGTAAAGTVIDGTARTSHQVLSTDGTALLSVGFATSAVHLLTITTEPAVSAHPSGVVVTYEGTA